MDLEDAMQVRSADKHYQHYQHDQRPSGSGADRRLVTLSVATIGTSHCDQACAHDVVRLAVGGGTHQCWPRQKWHMSCVLSHCEHKGVLWLIAHSSSGNRSAALHWLQKLSVTEPQSAHGLIIVAISPSPYVSIAPARNSSASSCSEISSITYHEQWDISAARLETNGYRRTAAGKPLTETCGRWAYVKSIAHDGQLHALPVIQMFAGVR